MSYEINWLVQDRVLLSSFHGTLTADELKKFVAEVRSKAAESDDLIYHISNSLGLKKVEFSLSTAKNAMGALDMLKEIAWQIDINQNPLNSMVANILSQLVNMRTRTFKTPEEAIEFVKHLDESLEEANWKLELFEQGPRERV